MTPILKRAWNLILLVIIALTVAVGSGALAAVLTGWKVGIDGTLSKGDKRLISRAFWTPVFAALSRFSFVIVEDGWPD